VQWPSATPLRSNCSALAAAGQVALFDIREPSRSSRDAFKELAVRLDAFVTAAAATESKHCHPSPQRIAEIWTVLLAQALYVEYQFASRRVEWCDDVQLFLFVQQ